MRTLTLVSCLLAIPLLSRPARAELTLEPPQITLIEVLASLEKSRALLKGGDRAGCRATLRELSAKMSSAHDPFQKQVRRQLGYVQIALFLRMNGMGMGQLDDLVAEVREHLRQGTPPPDRVP